MKRRSLLINGVGGLTALSIPLLIHHHTQKLPPIHVHYPGMNLGHNMRDLGHELAHDPQGFVFPDTLPVHCDVLIIGSGTAALACAWRCLKQSGLRVVMLSGPELGGNNAGTYWQDHSAPTAAHYLAIPSQQSMHVRQILADLGLMRRAHSEQAQRDDFPEECLVHAPAERMWKKGKWQDHFLDERDADTRRFLDTIKILEKEYRQGRKRFAVPLDLSAPFEPELMQQSFAAWLDAHQYHSRDLRWYLDYCCLDEYGAGSAQVCAFAGLHYFAARNNDLNAVLTWSDGLATLARLWQQRMNVQIHTPFEANLPPQWMLKGAAYRVREGRDAVEVAVQDMQGQRFCLQSAYAVLACPLAVSRHLLERPEDYALTLEAVPQHSPWLVGNFLLHGYPAEKKSALAWDNIVFGSPRLGYVNAEAQTIRHRKSEAGFLTSYTALCGLTADSPSLIRQKLLHMNAEELFEIAAADLHHVYGRYFRPSLSQVDVFVRGHGMAIPTPNAQNHPNLQRLKTHHSRVLFAHSDLAAYSTFEEASWYGVQAAEKIIGTRSLL